MHDMELLEQSNPLQKAELCDAVTRPTPPQRVPLGEGDVEKKRLRMPRTKAYINAIEQIDSPSETDNQITEAIKALPVNNKLLGVLSSCGIPGCIIHAIDKWGNILEHYRTIEEIPPDLREGYAVYQQYPSCTAVEVYTFTLCIIYGDGTIKLIERIVL